MAVANWTVVVGSFVCGASGAAAGNHHSNVNPTVRPRSQISDNTIIAPGTIFALSLERFQANSNFPGGDSGVRTNLYQTPLFRRY